MLVKLGEKLDAYRPRRCIIATRICMRSTIAAPTRRLFLGAIASIATAVAPGPAVASIAVVGDSLAAGCPFSNLSRRPFDVMNLARAAHGLRISPGSWSGRNEVALGSSSSTEA